MKTLVGSDLGSYTFDKNADKISISGLFGILTKPEQVLLVTNTSSNTMMYNFAGPPGLTLAEANPLVHLTLDFDCDAMADADSLQIYLDLNRAQSVSVSGDVDTLQANQLVKKKYNHLNIDYGGLSSIDASTIPDGEINKITYKDGAAQSGSGGTVVTYLYFSYITSGDSPVIDQIVRIEP